MSGELKIEPLTRVEGHGNVVIRVEAEKKRIKEVEFNVVESPRFFEKLLQGKPAEEAPRMSERICGICYVDHLLASVKAVEDAWNVEIPETALLLRKLIHHADIITSHTLHLAFLCLPDLLDIKERNFVGLAEVRPDLVKLALNLHEYGNSVVEEIGGRIIHTVTAIPGGMSKPLTEEKRSKLSIKASEAVKNVKEFAEKTLRFFEEKADLLSYPLKGTYYAGLTRDGQHELYDGYVKVIDSNGNSVYRFKSSEYLDYIAERVSEHSFVKLPYLRKIGFPEGSYRVGPLARLNIAEKIVGSQEYLETWAKTFGKPSNHLMAYNMARLVELISSVEAAHELLNDERIISENVRVPVKEKRGVGVGIVEAPRGILIHHYETNNEGIIINANVIPPTTHNAPSIEANIRELAEHQIPELLSSNNQQALWKMETLVRAYDPCISCATHLIKIETEKSAIKISKHTI